MYLVIVFERGQVELDERAGPQDLDELGVVTGTARASLSGLERGTRKMWLSV